MVHNPDVQSYARLLKKAEEAGIYVVQVNMRSSYSTDVFVGADYVGMGEQILIMTFVVVVIGGVGSIRGAFFGALLVGLVDTSLRAFMPGLLRQVMTGSEADAHLAEVASCHQVLALVLSSPATVDPACRQRLKDFQNLVLARREAMKPRMRAEANFTELLGEDRALEFATLELPFIVSYGSSRK